MGITLAAARPAHVRSLVTINAPLLPVRRRQRWTTSYPLALLYRLTGPSPMITTVLFDTLLSADAIEAQSERAADMISAFQRTDRGSSRSAGPGTSARCCSTPI